MAKEEVKNEIEKALEKMGCTDILFLELTDETVVVVFNCKDLTSFIAELPGWIHAGIELDQTKNRQYKIKFSKKS